MFLVPIDNELAPAQQSMSSYEAALAARLDAIRAARKGLFLGAALGMIAGGALALNDQRMLSIVAATSAPLAGYAIGHFRAVGRWRDQAGIAVPGAPIAPPAQLSQGTEA